MASSARRAAIQPSFGALLRLGLFLSIAPGASASPNPCEIFRPWLESRQVDITRIPTPEGRFRAQRAESEARESAALAVYESYIGGALPSGALATCLPAKEDFEAILPDLSQVFHRRSLDRLRAAGILELDRLVSRIEREIAERGLNRFRAIPHYPKESGPPENSTAEGSSRRAGVYRGTGSLFMNFDTIASDEWLFLLVHEMSHQADPILSEASSIWNDQPRAKAIFALDLQKHSLEELTETERRSLREYLEAGLNRGLIAELRAWTLCFSAYEAGRQTGLWGSIPWVEEVISRRRPGESIAELTMRYLDPRFPDPEESGLFSLKIVREQQASLRSELRANPGSSISYDQASSHGLQ